MGGNGGTGVAAQAVEPFRRLLQTRLEAGDPMQTQQVLEAVLQRDPLADQPLALPLRSPHVFLGLARDAHHRAYPRFTPQPRQQGAQQHVEIDPVSFRPPPPPFHRDARRMHDLHLDAMCQQISRDPEPVSACFIGQHSPAHGSARPLCLHLPSFDLLQQSRHVTRWQNSTRTPGDTRQHRSDLPALATQFQRQHQRAIVIEGGCSRLNCHRIVPDWVWTTDRIHAAATVHPHSILIGGHWRAGAPGGGPPSPTAPWPRSPGPRW
jgi:hypothetical protein